MQRIIANLIAHPRTSLLGGLFTLVVLAGLLTMISPVRISISIAADDPAAGAAPAAILPTTTPAPPPTEQPPTQQPPTATAILIPQPTETSAPPTETHIPEPTATSTSEPTATAILIPPPAEEEPPTDEPTDRTTRDDPTPQPTSAAPPTVTPQTILITPEPTVGTPNVVVTKQASRREVRIGDELSYTLTATNNGTAPAEAVVVTDAMPAPLEIISVVSSQGSASASGQSITVQVGTLAPGQQAVITIMVRVRAAVQPGDISNLAMVFTSTPGDPPGDNTTTTTITILPPEPAPTVAPPAGAQPPRAATTTQPQRMPKTADPEEAMRFLMTFLPLILLAFGAGIFGLMLNRSAFRQQVLVAFTATAPVQPRRPITRALSAAPAAVEPAAAEPAPAAPVHVGDVTIDLTRSDELYARWQAGASVNDLVDELARRNPQVSKAVLMVAIQNVLTSFIRP